LLVAAFHSGTNVADGRFQVGLVVAMGSAVVIMGIALTLAWRELRVRRSCSVGENLSQQSVISRQ
jgi:hypothetical protein